MKGLMTFLSGILSVIAVGVLLIAYGLLISGFDVADGNLIKQPAFDIGCDYHISRMRNPRDGFVVEVDHARREENKNQDQRDHDVVVQRATLVGPENVSANCAPNGVHWQGRRAGRGRRDFRSLQV